MHDPPPKSEKNVLKTLAFIHFNGRNQLKYTTPFASLLACNAGCPLRKLIIISNFRALLWNTYYIIVLLQKITMRSEENQGAPNPCYY